MEKEMSVTKLAEALGQRHSMVSHNLKLLEQCSLVFPETRGRRKYVTANVETVGSLLGLVEKHRERYCEHNGRCPHQR